VGQHPRVRWRVAQRDTTTTPVCKAFGSERESSWASRHDPSTYHRPCPRTPPTFAQDLRYVGGDDTVLLMHTHTGGSAKERGWKRPRFPYIAVVAMIVLGYADRGRQRLYSHCCGILLPYVAHPARISATHVPGRRPLQMLRWVTFVLGWLAYPQAGFFLPGTKVCRVFV
jgi:hypothetical protein